MATTINTGGCSDNRSPCHPAPDECPTCGGLECLCRPRFFAGQLLTEENLNHLNQYIIKKNQLHNRYLHGTGVVCGLEVSCDPCDDRRVSIAEGYALSPCGNDIVVCAEDSVDICELIQDCRSKDPRDCRPYAKPDKSCRGVEETWLLAICYEETASRGITALRSSSSEKSCSDTAPRGAPPQCEPTQICEGYRYRLFKIPDENERKDPSGRDSVNFGNWKLKGPFYQRLMCCIEPLLELITSSQQNPDTPWLQRCCKIKAELREIILSHASGNCELLKRLECIQCEQELQTTALLHLLNIWWQLLVDCLCNALMPPCPEPSMHDCVTLAAITVSGSNCKVKKVCNWTEHRKYVLTMPTLKYWLSILTQGVNFSGVIEQFCCDTKGLMDAVDPCSAKKIDVQGVNPSIVGAGLASEEAGIHPSVAISIQPELDTARLKYNQEFSKIGLRAFTRTAGSLTLETLVRGLSESPDDDGKAEMSEAERNNPGEFLMMNMLIQPVLRSFIPGGRLQKTGIDMESDSTGDEIGHADLSEIQAEMKCMKTLLDSQAAEIQKLRTRLDGSD